MTSQLKTITPFAAVIGMAENDEIKSGKLKSFNIPDGAILLANISLFIESKIGYNSYLLKEQLEGHKNLFPEKQKVQSEPIIIKWKEIRDFFRRNYNYYEIKNDSLTCFLLKQFEEFCIIYCIGDKQNSKEYFF